MIANGRPDGWSLSATAQNRRERMLDTVLELEETGSEERSVPNTHGPT
jgi:hypothetical protein